MWRLPLHPIFRILLPLALLVWLCLVATNPADHLRGIVARYTGEQLGFPTKSAPAPKSEKIYFYISPDGSIDAFGTETLTMISGCSDTDCSPPTHTSTSAANTSD